MKKLLSDLLQVKKFENNLILLSHVFNKNKKYKVSITKEQMKILEYCAVLGIDNENQLEEYINIKNPLRKFYE